MKRIITICAVVIMATSVYAQAPQKMSYQAVIRNSSNALITSTPVGMQISILQGSPTGTAVYVETQTPTTNINGLASIEIGAGTVVSGDFATIDWSAGPYFIKTETDPSGGTSYSITGTNELISVPYALFSTNGTPGPQGPQGDTGATGGYPVHYIGESYGGGIVFYVYDGGQHGLIAATSDQSIGIRWYGGSYTNTRARGDGIGAGLKNTAIIIANQGPVDGAAFAATVCNEYSVTVGGTTYGDWYLPSKYELNLMYQNIGQGDALGLGNVGGFASSIYWSSTESASPNAWYQHFNDGLQFSGNKFGPNDVRAVRAF